MSNIIKKRSKVQGRVKNAEIMHCVDSLQHGDESFLVSEYHVLGNGIIGT